MQVLAVGAHPDDLEILCAGTLSRFASEGHEVTMCHVASGNRGSYRDDQSSQLGQVRASEAQEAAEVISARHATLGVPDGEIDSMNEEQKRRMVDVLRAARADVLITHSPADYWADHTEAGRLAIDSSFLATLKLYETNLPHCETVPAVFFMDTVAGLGFEPSEYVDISDHIERKVEMFLKHVSQASWLMEHDGVDMEENIRSVARFRGLQCGVQYAEGFQPMNTWLRARTMRLLP